jgi:hypothetical protein
MSSDRTTRLARQVLFLGAWLMVACLVIQLFLVGLDVFSGAGDVGAIHRQWAYAYGWLAPALVLLAAVARVPRWFLIATIALLVLFAIQTYLPSLKDRAPVLAATHAVNALAVFWLSVLVARRSRELLEAPQPHGGS